MYSWVMMNEKFIQKSLRIDYWCAKMKGFLNQRVQG